MPLSTAWTPCSPPSRCRPGSRWPRWRWTGATNAALLAVAILALGDEELTTKLATVSVRPGGEDPRRLTPGSHNTDSDTIAPA